MPIFIAVNLVLSLSVTTNFFYSAIFSEILFFILGSLAIISSLIGALKKASFYQWWYDLFAVGTLLIWFAYWHYFYKDGYSIFYIMPSYFVLFSSILLLVFVNRRERFDLESIEHIRFLVNNDRFRVSLIGFMLLVSIYFHSRFTFFPALMSAFILRYSLVRSLEPYKRP